MTIIFLEKSFYGFIFVHRIIPVSLSFSWMERLTARNLRPLVSRHVTVRLTRLQEGLLPDKGKLPVFVAVGGLQGDVASAVAFGFPFQKAGTVVGVGMEGEVA